MDIPGFFAEIIGWVERSRRDPLRGARSGRLHPCCSADRFASAKSNKNLLAVGRSL